MRLSIAYTTFLILATLSLSSCKKTSGTADEVGAPSAAGTSAPSSVIAIDGSSTVFPITQAVAEEYQKVSGAKIAVGVSGTGGGFKKFCKKEIAISGASRPVKPSEVEMCKASGVEFIELPVAYDGLAVVVHIENDWVDQMTVEELKKLWAPEAQDKIKKWSQVRPGWPDKEIHLFGPGIDSGTYDYFTKAIVGKEHASRGDFTSSEDDNVLVQGISTDKLALGFFGFAYYEENKDTLKLVPINDGNDENGAGAVAPSRETVEGGTYQPLSRPVFIYVSKEAAQREEIKGFVSFYLNEGAKLIGEVGYIALPEEAYGLVQKRFSNGTTGTLFEAGSKVGVTVEKLLGGG